MVFRWLVCFLATAAGFSPAARVPGTVSASSKARRPNPIFARLGFLGRERAGELSSYTATKMDQEAAWMTEQAQFGQYNGAYGQNPAYMLNNNLQNRYGGATRGNKYQSFNQPGTPSRNRPSAGMYGQSTGMSAQFYGNAREPFYDEYTGQPFYGDNRRADFQPGYRMPAQMLPGGMARPGGFKQQRLFEFMSANRMTAAEVMQALEQGGPMR